MKQVNRILPTPPEAAPSAIASKLSRLELKNSLFDFIQLLAGSLLAIMVFNLFLAPSQIAPGGVSGLSLVIHAFTGLPEGLTMLVINLPILVAGYYTLGRRQFLVKTVFVVLVYTVGVDILNPYFPPAGFTDDPLLIALFGGVIGGFSSGLMFRAGGTAAGTSVISRILQLRSGIPVSQLYMVIDGTIILLVALTFGWDKALYALIMLFVWGIATDYVLEGPSVVRTATIVTDAPSAITTALMSSMGVGVTGWAVKGMFTEQERTVLFCTVSRPDVRNLQMIVLTADPQAFIVIGQAHQRSGGVIKAAKKNTASKSSLVTEAADGL